MVVDAVVDVVVSAYPTRIQSIPIDYKISIGNKIALH